MIAPFHIGDFFEATRMMSELRLSLFFDILKEARKGPGVTDTNAMFDAMEGRAVLGRISKRLNNTLVKEGK